MQLDHEFTVNVTMERAWAVLTDLEGIAPCLPGAQLTGVEGDVYSGRVKVKVGPVISEYAGTARFVEKDDAAYRAVIDAKGKDPRGASNAAAAIHASLRPDGDQTVVTVNTELTISGKIAQFGSGMIKEVSAKLLTQFVQNLEASLLAPVAVAAEPPTVAATPVSVGVPIRRVIGADQDAAPLDLMKVAGGSVYKRLIPLAVGFGVVVALLVYLLVRK
jgi:uncharacterized protein